MAIKIKLEGFDELIKKIEAAGGTVDRACTGALSQSAQIMQSALKRELSAATESDLANKIPPPRVGKDGNTYIAAVGFQETPYNPQNLSDFHKAIFLNYGTPHRSKHGKEQARGFVARAKKSAKTPIKKAQQTALETILQRLKK